MASPTRGALLDERWSALATSTVSDALDRCGVSGQAWGITPVSEISRLIGRAFTVHYVPTAGRAGSVGDYVDEVLPGSVIVLDNGGRTDASVWGGILTLFALRRRLAGTVIHGVSRDSALINETGYPVFARGVTMRTGKDRVRVKGLGSPVSLGTTSVRPGDLIIGDSDGVVVVPQVMESDVLEASCGIERAEESIRRAIAQGTRLDVARKEAGYHELQRKRRR